MAAPELDGPTPIPPFDHPNASSLEYIAQNQRSVQFLRRENMDLKLELLKLKNAHEGELNELKEQLSKLETVSRPGLEMQWTQNKKGTGRKGIRTKKWKSCYDEVLVPFLVDLASKGYKIHKTFKETAFVMAANHINQKFDENFSHVNVENHLRIFKDKWRLICQCRRLSEAEWDDATKTITLHGKTYEEDVKAHPEHKQYLNQPIEKYEELRIICGEDMATGEFMRTSYDTEEKNEPEPVNLNNDNCPIELPSLQTNDDSVPSQKVVDKSSRPSKKRRRKNAPAVLVQELKGGLKDIANAIDANRQDKWLEKLSKIVWDMQEFEMGDLNLVFTELYKNELDAKAFIVKPQEIQRMDVFAILRKHHRVSNMGTSMREGSLNGAMDGISSGDDTI